MISLAKSPLAPMLGQRVPSRGTARLLYDRMTRPSPVGGDLLAVPAQVAPLLSGLLG